jgi:hypothetical protein
MSTKDRLERRKYMGVCRWGSEIMARMMSKFPRIVTRYIERKNPKMRGCNLGSSEIPRRRNSEICVSFSALMLLICLTQKEKEYDIFMQC